MKKANLIVVSLTAVTCLSACNINITPSVEEVQPIEINVNIGDTDVQIDTDENNANAVDNEQNDDKEAEHKWVLSKETNINDGGQISYIRYYDEAGNDIKTEFYYDGSLYIESESSFDEKGNRIVTSTYELDRDLTAETKWIYNENGNIATSTTYYNKGYIGETRYEYVYI